MTRTEFLTLLEQHDVDPALVCFEDPVKDGFCVRKNHCRWEVLYRERGKEYEVLGFPSESDALTCLFHKLVK